MTNNWKICFGICLGCKKGADCENLYKKPTEEQIIRHKIMEECYQKAFKEEQWPRITKELMKNKFLRMLIDKRK